MHAVNVPAGHCEPADGRVQRPVEQARAHRGAAELVQGHKEEGQEQGEQEEAIISTTGALVVITV